MALSWCTSWVDETIELGGQGEDHRPAVCEFSFLQTRPPTSCSTKGKLAVDVTRIVTSWDFLNAALSLGISM